MMGMSLIHAQPGWGKSSSSFGKDSVLLAMDAAGVDSVLAALTQAARQGSARLGHGATTHQFLIEAGTEDIEFGEGTVVWRLDAAKAAEIIEFLTEMHDHPGSGHHYVDISTPADELVLSLNEYPPSMFPPEATFPPRNAAHAWARSRKCSISSELRVSGRLIVMVTM